MQEIIDIFNERQRQSDIVFSPWKERVTIATWSMRIALGEKYTCAELRKIMDKMPEIERDPYRSRRGNAVWRMKKPA